MSMPTNAPIDHMSPANVFPLHQLNLETIRIPGTRFVTLNPTDDRGSNCGSDGGGAATTKSYGIITEE